MAAHAGNKGLLFGNPLLRRYRHSLLRPSQFWVYVVIYAAVVGLILFINYSIVQLKNEPIDYEKLCDRIYYQFVALQVLILVGWTALSSRAALRQEVTDKTYDFFRLFPLSALQKTIGILVGRNLPALVFGTITFVLIIAFGPLGKASRALQFQIVLLLLSAAFFSSSTALLSCGASPRQRRKMSVAVWILLFVFFGPFLLQLLFLPFFAMSQIRKAELLTVQFYRFEVRILIAISIMLLYFGIWSILGILRRFTYEGQPLFSRMGALLFLLGYELLALGFFFPHLQTNRMAVYAFWLSSLAPALFVPLGSMNAFEHYLESCGLIRSAGPRIKRVGLKLFSQSNLTLGFLLLAMWAAFAVVVSRMAGVPGPHIAGGILTLLSFCVALLLLVEVYVVYSPTFGKIGLLLCFAALLYLFLPIILWPALDNPNLRFYSLFGYGAFLLNPMATKPLSAGPYVVTVNIVYCVVLAALVIRRYIDIFRVRGRM